MLGVLVVTFTLIYALKALADLNWEIEEVKAHTIFGLFMLACVPIIGFLGFLKYILSIYWQPRPWSKSTELHIRIGAIHKFLARRLLIVGCVTTSTGLAQY